MTNNKGVLYLYLVCFCCALICLSGCSSHSYYRIRPVKHTFSEITFRRDGTFQDCLCGSSGKKYVTIGNWKRQGDTITVNITKLDKLDSAILGDLIFKMSERKFIVEDEMLYSIIMKDDKLLKSYESPYKRAGKLYRRKCRGREKSVTENK